MTIFYSIDRGPTGGNRRTRGRKGPSPAPLLARALVLAAVGAIAGVSPAYAIPSPDLAVNFLSSAGQVLGMISVTLGGIFLGRKQTTVSGVRRKSSGGVPLWLVAGLAAIAGTVIVANVLLWAHAADTKNRRLEASLVRPSVENGETVGDTTLKTLSYSEQVSHPAGITTDELSALLADSAATGSNRINLIDLREPEEKEAGHLPQFAQARYPDLTANPRRFGVRKGKTTVLLCYSGNRSSETCEQLAARGIPCKFVVGGYEKWLTEGRGIAGADNRTAGDLRSIPAYANDSVLLDTADVKELVAERGAVFVDVRYPGDFKPAHLPGAINMPVRKMTTAKLKAAVGKLPAKPVIAPCYDKRSCFYAKILGLRLSRAGFEFLGRYTVPHEYFVERASRTHVAQWQAEQSKSLLEIASAPLARLLRATAEFTGAVPISIFIVVFGLRLLVFPLTAKAERDQVVMRRIAPEMAELKERIGSDRVRLGRAMKALNRRHRMTPGLNMLGITVQIPLFLAFFFAVDAVAREVTADFLWINDISRPDSLYVLPAFLGLLIFMHLECAAARQSILLTGLRLSAGILLAAVTAPISAAVNLYLVFNISLMALQSMPVRSCLKGGSQAPELPARPATAGARPPHVCAIQDVAGYPDFAGGKAVNLAEIAAAGLPVADGFVVTREALGADRVVSPEDWVQVEAMWKKMRFDRAAVRSSGLNEDGEDRSYAGVFETVLDVGHDGLFEALRRVRDSFVAETANVYGEGSGESGAIVVQKMVDAEYAGVMFTEHPGSSGSILVELTQGLGVGVVDGTAETSTFEFGRLSGRLLDETQPPVELGPLLALGRRLETLFDGPQDVEWAYAGGKFVILQSRAITALARKQTANRREHLLECERHRLLSLAAGDRPDEPIFVQNELSELLPRPTPFSLALMEEMWRPGGTMDMACRALGIRYNVGEDAPPFVTTVFGALYINRPEEQRRMRSSGGFLTTLRLARMAPAVEDNFWNQFVPTLDDDIRLYERVDFNKFGDTELFTMLDQVCTRFVTENYVQAHVINILANFYFSQAEKALSKRGLPAAEYLSNAPSTVVNHAMALLSGAKSDRAVQRDFLELFGHRAPVDYEVADPRYTEDPAQVEALIASAQAVNGRASPQRRNGGLPNGKALRLSIERAGNFQCLKEEAKHHCLRELAVIRRILLALGARLGLDEDIFQLTRDEIAGLQDGAAFNAAREVITQRQEAAEIFAGLPAMPSELAPADLERLSLDGSQRALNGHSAALKGSLVAGQAPIRGRARVATGTSIEALEQGEILITRFLHPTWAPALPRVAGVVTEIGGWLSHAAILAREYNVPTIVGVRGVLERIVTGDQVQLNSDGSIELI